MMQVKNFKKTITLFTLKNMFQHKLLSSSVIKYKAMKVEFIISRKCYNVINSNNRNYKAKRESVRIRDNFRLP